MEPNRRHDYKNINAAVIVPRLNISIEDLIVCICPAMVGNGVAAVLSYISEAAGIFTIITGLFGTVSLYAFARKKRKDELRHRGYSHSGILRRYIAYLLGNEWLRCR